MRVARGVMSFVDGAQADGLDREPHERLLGEPAQERREVAAA